MDVQGHQARLARFAADRDWEQFHTPTNLAAALAVEACELLAAAAEAASTSSTDQELIQRLVADARLLEARQWHLEAPADTPTPPPTQELLDEIADVAIYLLRLADVVDADLDVAVTSKAAENARRYPASAVRGSASKRLR